MRRRDCENKCENVVQNKIASDSVKCQAFEASVAVSVAVAAGDTDAEGERVTDTRYIIAWLTCCCCRCCVSMTVLREAERAAKPVRERESERGSAPACLCVRESDTNTSIAAIAA